MTILFSLGAVEAYLRLTDYGTMTPEMNFGVNTKQALLFMQTGGDH